MAQPQIKMRVDKSYKFYVIQFLQPPYKGIDDFVCVPANWIKDRGPNGIYAAYPSERLPTTKNIVKSRQDFDKEWKFYLCKLKYGTDCSWDGENIRNTLLKPPQLPHSKHSRAEENKSKMNTGDASTSQSHKRRASTDCGKNKKVARTELATESTSNISNSENTSSVPKDLAVMISKLPEIVLSQSNVENLRSKEEYHPGNTHRSEAGTSSGSTDGKRVQEKEVNKSSRPSLQILTETAHSRNSTSSRPPIQSGQLIANTAKSSSTTCSHPRKIDVNAPSHNNTNQPDKVNKPRNSIRKSTDHTSDNISIRPNVTSNDTLISYLQGCIESGGLDDVDDVILKKCLKAAQERARLAAQATPPDVQTAQATPQVMQNARVTPQATKASRASPHAQATPPAARATSQAMQAAQATAPAMQAARATSQAMQAVQASPQAMQAAQATAPAMQAAQAAPQALQAARATPPAMQAAQATAPAMQAARATPPAMQAAQAAPQAVQAARATPPAMQAAQATAPAMQAARATPPAMQAAQAAPQDVQAARATPPAMQTAQAAPQAVQAARATSQAMQAAQATPPAMRAVQATLSAMQASRASPQDEQAVRATLQAMQAAQATPPAMQSAQFALKQADTVNHTSRIPCPSLSTLNHADHLHERRRTTEISSVMRSIDPRYAQNRVHDTSDYQNISQYLMQAYNNQLRQTPRQEAPTGSNMPQTSTPINTTPILPKPNYSHHSFKYNEGYINPHGYHRPGLLPPMRGNTQYNLHSYPSNTGQFRHSAHAAMPAINVNYPDQVPQENITIIPRSDDMIYPNPDRHDMSQNTPLAGQQITNPTGNSHNKNSPANTVNKENRTDTIDETTVVIEHEEETTSSVATSSDNNTKKSPCDSVQPLQISSCNEITVDKAGSEDISQERSSSADTVKIGNFETEDTVTDLTNKIRNLLSSTFHRDQIEINLINQFGTFFQIMSDNYAEILEVLSRDQKIIMEKKDMIDKAKKSIFDFLALKNQNPAIGLTLNAPTSASEKVIRERKNAKRPTKDEDECYDSSDDGDGHDNDDSDSSDDDNDNNNDGNNKLAGKKKTVSSKHSDKTRNTKVIKKTAKRDGNISKSDSKNSKEETKKRGKKLPMPRNHENPRSALIYHTAAPGTIELIPKSGIYVNANKLGHCKSIAKSYNELARMLLPLIFSKKGLTTLRVYAFAGDKKDVKTGLYKNAIRVLLLYVEKVGKKRKWEKCDVQSVVNSLRAELRD